MNVCLATYQSIMLLQGGPRTQIFRTKEGLEEHGIGVRLYASWEEFRREDVDLVHLFGAHLGTYHLAREIHKLNIPLVVTPIFFSRHSPLFLRAASAADRAVRHLVRGHWTDYGMLSEICSWADAVLPNTRREGELLRRGLGVRRERIVVVPNGVEERFYRADPELFRKQHGIGEFVLNVGHIGPGRKNVLRLIRALEKINVPGVIIGRIEQNEYGRQCLEEAKRNPRLLILDALSNDSEMLASAYAACDVFALPSLFETPGIAALEAGLAGAKIVVTKYGGTDEYFGAEAGYVEPTSVELIRHGIVTALNRNKSDALRERIRREFLWGTVAQKTKEVYERVLAARR